MESVDGNGGSQLVVMALSHIKELVRQLEVHLVGSPDLCKHLASQIFSLIERSIDIITSSGLGNGRKWSAADAGLASATPSPLSDVFDMPLKITKKRKTMKKRKHQVRVSSAGGGESPVDDGHSWRKYGQKDILGAKHPRGYYRCTHRHSQGCAATKQVQRTDEDPTLFDVIYYGEHTCVHKAAAAAAAEAAGQAAAAAQPLEHNPDAHNLLQSLTVKTERLAVATEPQSWSATTPFCLSSTPASGGLARAERSPFSTPETLENGGVSPATSDSNYVVSFPPFEAAARDAEWQAQLVPAVDIPDEFLDIDIIASLFAEENADPHVGDEE